MSEKVVTAIVQKGNSNRCLIYVDGIPAVNCLYDIILQNNVFKGKIVTDEFLQSLRDEQRIVKLKQKALSFATYKPRTEYQVRQRMLEKEFTEDEALIAINFLKEFGYLNDENFAKMFVGDYLLKKPAAEKKVFQELKKRGVAEGIIEKALKENFPKDETFNMALKAAEKKLRMVSYKPVEKQRESLVRYLQVNGFSWDVIKNVLIEVFPED
ncbi:MAG TPA: regulatory protein RecX [Patescibacteria group bacterium]|nr:regulatory protein RecX [Patescibacteria group bacterium]